MSGLKVFSFSFISDKILVFHSYGKPGRLRAIIHAISAYRDGIFDDKLRNRKLSNIQNSVGLNRVLHVQG